MSDVERSPSVQSKEPNLYEQMLANPVMRAAYFGTTQAQLFGDPESPVVQAIEELLDSEHVAFLYSRDKYLAHPALQIIGVGEFVGDDEIRRAIAHFLTREVVVPLPGDLLLPIEPSVVPLLL